MDANGKKATIEELLTRAWNAIENSRDYLEEFHRRQNALKEQHAKLERGLSGWQIPESQVR